jgi:GGDEF domain-containing protein
LLAVVLPAADIELGRRIARRMAQEVDRLNAEAWPQEPPVSLSFGVATAVAHDAEELFAAAEANLGQPVSARRRTLAGQGREERDGPSVA